MMRVRFSKPCHHAGRTYQPGEEADLDTESANQIAHLGAGEIIGQADPVEPPPSPKKRLPRKVTNPAA